MTTSARCSRRIWCSRCLGSAASSRDATPIVASYREFIERVTLTSYREEQLVVYVWGDTAVASYRWDMAWLAGGIPSHQTGQDVFAFQHHTNGVWLAIWRTMTFDQKNP